MSERDVRYSQAYHYPLMQRPDCTVAEQKEFANLWADDYYARGLTFAEAWKVFTRH